MKKLCSICGLTLGFSLLACTSEPIPELHQVRAERCLDPGNPAYDMNQGEPKCPNPPLTDPNGEGQGQH